MVKVERNIRNLEKINSKIKKKTIKENNFRQKYQLQIIFERKTNKSSIKENQKKITNIWQPTKSYPPTQADTKTNNRRI